MRKSEKKKRKQIKRLKSKLKVGDWNISHEREFAENLFVGRFNYFLVAFSLFVTAGFANNLKPKYTPFYAGAVILLVFWIPLYRAYKKHDRVIKIIFRDMPDHPAYVVEKILKKEGWAKWLVISTWMGIFIPLFCSLFLLAIGFSIQLGWMA